VFCVGIDWSEQGYGACVIGPDGGVRATFRVGQAVAETQRLITMLTARHGPCDGPSVCLVDSSNGALADLLAEAGVRVHRVDPPLLGAPPSSGAALAAAGRQTFARTTALGPRSGFLRGRMRDLMAHAAECGAIEAALAGRAQFLAHGDRSSPLVALTFDDGPHPPYTTEILDILREYEVPATFYCIGMRVAAYPEITKRIVAEGHALGNHSWSHAFLPDLGDDDVYAQVRLTTAASTKATGAAPTSFRPPYGGRSPRVLRVLAGLGQVTVLWDVDSRDWSRPGARYVAERVLDRARAGSIVLLHDGGGDRSQTVAALPRLITGLRERGHRLATVDRLVSAAARGGISTR
jgi:peptidoglycan-N-acetylglucosamine deacetylase